MWKKYKDLTLYAMLDPDQFHSVEPMVAAENSFTLKLAAIVQILYFGVSFIGSLQVSEMADKKLVYGFGTVFPLLILILHLLFSQKHPEIISWLVRCYGLGIFVTGLLCTLICTPDELTILLLIFFFCVPMLFIMRPGELILLVLVTDIVYFAAAPFLKAANILTMDMIDIAIFSTLSLILGVSQMLSHYRRYWLEMEAKELAKIRYKAAFMDQLTGTYNRNAYNKDIEELKAAALPLNFIYIALDINGLKKANDTYGHVAGDELIVGAAECMKNSFSEYGKVYRVGGDEFNMVLNAENANVGELLNGFNQKIAAWKGDFNQKLSVSYGVVLGTEVQGQSLHEIELLADRRMYQVKSDYYKNSGLERRKI